MDASTAAVFGILIVLIAGVGEVTRRAFRVTLPVADADSPIPQIPVGLLGMLQLATAVVAAFVPLAAGLYLLVTVTWTLVQRIVLRRVYPPVS